MHVRSLFRSLTIPALLCLAACGKEGTEVAGKAPPAPGNVPAPLVVDQKMMEATQRVEEAAAEAAAALRKAGVTKALRFSGIPNQNTTDLAAKYKPLADYLSAKLGVTFEYVPATDYNATVDGFKNGDLLLCWFGGYTGVQARSAVAGARAIACGPRDMKFKSYFVAHQKTGWKKSADFPLQLAGHSFTFGSQQSTSGRLMPEYFIRKFTQKSPQDFFGSAPGFQKGHDKTLEMVASGAFEAGVVDYTVYEKLVKEGKVDPAVVPVIWESPAYLDYQFTAHSDVDRIFGAGFTDRLQQTLISIPEQDRAVLKAMDRDQEGLIACRNEDFETLRKLAVDIGLLR